HANAAMHANEWITAPLLVAFLEDLAESAVKGDVLCGKTGAELLRSAFPLADISVRDAIRDDFGHPGDADKAADAGADEAGADGGGTAEDDGAMAEDDAAEADDEATAEDDAMADGNRQEGGTDHERA